MDHEIGGVAFRVSGLSAAIANGRSANGCELTAPASWTSVRVLVGADVALVTAAG